MTTPARLSRFEPPPIVSIILAGLVLQGGASLAKTLFPALGGPGAVTLRLIFASLMMLALWRPWRTPLDPKSRGPMVAYGLALGAMNLTFYLALERTPRGLAVALEFVGPLGVAVAGSRKPIDLLWVAMAAAGVLVLVNPMKQTGSGDLIGYALSLGAGGFWALYILCTKRASAFNPGHASAYGMLVACALVLPVGLITAGGRLATPSLWPTAIAVALLTSALPYSLEMAAMRRMSSRVFGVLMSMDPAIAALSGFLVLGERLNPTQIVAIGLIMAASVGAVLKP